MYWRRPNPLNIKNVGAGSSLSKGVYRSRLQELSQKCGFGLPVYTCCMEGSNKFKATVKFNGQVFTHPDYCGSLKAAQHAAAEVAFISTSQSSTLRLLLAAKANERALHKRSKDKLWKDQEVPNVVPPTKVPQIEKEITRETQSLGIPCEEDIECGCCFSECPFEKMVQCADGHLFCFSCLRRHVEEALFGSCQISGGLSCIHTDGCNESFPRSEVLRVLPSELILKYERLQAEDAVTRAKLSGLVYCPFCNFPCELDPGISIFKCPYEKCGKQSCTKCREPNHLPLQCHEVEKESETALRKQVEEDMTQAIIRTCYACKAELVKDDGCNKITCRCGESICYVCRQPIKAYAHFCQPWAHLYHLSAPRFYDWTEKHQSLKKEGGDRTLSPWLGTLQTSLARGLQRDVIPTVEQHRIFVGSTARMLLFLVVHMPPDLVVLDADFDLDMALARVASAAERKGLPTTEFGQLFSVNELQA